jgi:hypothetical protein
VRKDQKQKINGGYVVSFWLPEQQLAIDVYECEPHGCQKCYPHSKYIKQIQFDAEKAAYFKSVGQKYVVIWEHEMEGMGPEGLKKIIDRESAGDVLGIIPKEQGKITKGN